MCHTVVVSPVGKVLDVYHITKGMVKLRWKSVEMFCMHTEHEASRLPNCAVMRHKLSKVVAEFY